MSVHIWLREAIEDATGVDAYPVEMTGTGGPPYVVYARESTQRELVLDDALDAAPQPDQVPAVARFQVVIFSDSYVQAWEIAGQITAAVHKFRGSGSGWTIHDAMVTDESDGDAGYLEGREQPTYTVEMTIDIRWEP